jgi:hypothetical protein
LAGFNVTTEGANLATSAMYDGRLLKIASASAGENLPLRSLPFSL